MQHYKCKFPSHALIILDVKQQGESSMLAMLLMHPLILFFIPNQVEFYTDITYFIAYRFQKSLFLDFKKAIYRYACNVYDIIVSKVSN